MNFLAHALIGLAAAAGLNGLLGLGLQLNALTLSAVLFASLLPDADHNKAVMRKIIALALAVLALVGAFTAAAKSFEFVFAFVLSMAAAGIVFLLVKLFPLKHRGFTHSVAACFVFSLVIFAFSKSTALAIACFGSYASHLLADFEMKLF